MEKILKNCRFHVIQIMINCNKIFFFFVFVFLAACSRHDEIYNRFYSLPHSEWRTRKALQFEVPIKDISASYNVFIEIRHTNSYPFRNLWLFVEVQAPYRNYRRDTIQVELANMHGKWYGKGIHIYSYVLSYSSPVSYPDIGKYVYTIRQGMRTNPIKGISDIGLRILKKDATNK